VCAGTVGYTALLDGYVKAGQLAAAAALLDEMQATGCPPSETTVTVLLDMHARHRNFQVGDHACLGLPAIKSGPVGVDSEYPKPQGKPAT
jgi:pentatricopeptide repeat protein